MDYIECNQGTKKLLWKMIFKIRYKKLGPQFDLTQDDFAREMGVRRETTLFLEIGKYNRSLILAQ